LNLAVGGLSPAPTWHIEFFRSRRVFTARIWLWLVRSEEFQVVPTSVLPPDARASD
jgi:hypothetical protein